MMAHHEKLVVCIKVDGKVLREFKGKVLIPYGTEYQIYIKNLNSVRASVDLTIDGRSVFTNGSLLVNSNSDVTLERFVSNNETGNRFKFIELTEGIEAHRGAKAEDGVIRIAFKYEKVFQQSLPKPLLDKQQMPFHLHQPTWCNPSSDIYGATTKGILRGGVRGSMVANSVNLNSTSINAVAQNLSSNHPLQNSSFANETGITVEGSKSSQKFTTVRDIPLEYEEHVIVLHLLGDIGQAKVEKPITVKANFVCSSCGTKNKVNSKFCRECGTAVGLELVA